jgi:hypothetical protein
VRRTPYGPVHVCLSVAFIVGHFCATMEAFCYSYSCCYCYSLALPSPSQVRSSRPLEDRDFPRGASPPTELGYFRGLHHVGTPQVMPPRLLPTGTFYLTSGALPPRPFSGMHASLGLTPCTSCSWSSVLGLSILYLAQRGFGNPGLRTK